MGSTKSTLKIDEVGSPHKHSFSSIQNSVSTNNSASINDDYLVVKNNLEETPSSPFMRRISKESAQKRHEKVRPHSLFERSTTDFTKDVILQEDNENSLAEDNFESKEVEQSNYFNKSQYFRSFRYASRRFFAKKNNTMINSAHVNTNPTSHNNNNSSSSSFEKFKKSDSQTDFSNMETPSTIKNPNSISSVVKNFRNSLTNFSAFNNDTSNSIKNIKNSESLSVGTTNVKVRDVKMRGRAKANNTENTSSEPPQIKPRNSQVPGLTLESKAKLNQEEQVNQNENIIEHLKKQIDLLVEQLESVEREDSKIISELSEKIDNIARMNSTTINSVGVQQQQSTSQFSRLKSLFGIKSSPQQSPSSSQASFSGNSKLQDQNNILLQQQIQIEQLKQQLLYPNSFQYQQTPMNQSYAYSQSTVFFPDKKKNKPTKKKDTANDRNHDHATEEDEDSTADVGSNKQAPRNNTQFYNQQYYTGASNYTFPNNSTAYANKTNFYNPSNGTSYQYYPNTQAYYQAYVKQFQQQQQQQQTQQQQPQQQPQQQQPQQQQPGQNYYYDIQTGKYHYQKPTANGTSYVNSPYFYDPNTGAVYTNPNYVPPGQTNSNNDNSQATGDEMSGGESSSDADTSRSSGKGVIITEVDDEEQEEIDLSKLNRKKTKDYIDAISLKDE